MGEANMLRDNSIPVHGPSSTPPRATRPGQSSPGTPLPRKDRPFVRLDLEVFTRYFPTLTGGDRMVYLALAMHADAASTCFPSIKTLAREAGLHARKVPICLRRLEAL